MDTKARNKINIKNKKARFEYEIVESMVAGIKLQGTEIKSIREGRASLVESYCIIHHGEVYVKNMHIAEYKFGNINNHEMKRERKLLLNKREIQKLERKTKESGFTLIPLRLFMNDRGFVKLEIAVARGKKQFDKRETLKQKDAHRDMDRAMKF